MLDPAFVRDHLDDVRKSLLSRGLDASAELEQLATIEAQRKRLIPQVEGLKREQNTAGDEVARAKRQGLDASHIFEANKQRGQRIKQMEIELDGVERRRAVDPRNPAEPAACQRHRGRVRRRQPGGPHVGRAAHLRLRAQGALGPRSRARHPGLRACHQDLRRPLRHPDGRRRAARARAHQLHADAAHDAPRLHRGAAAVPRLVGLAVRHRAAAEVRARPVQDRRRLGSLPDSDRGSAGHQSLPRRDSRRAQPAATSTPPTRRASAAKPAPTARTSAGSSGSTSSTRWSS